MQLFANGQRCDDISEYGRCCFLYSLLKSSEWYRNKGITGFWEVGGAPAPVPAENSKDVLMAPTLIGMFQAGKFLPPQLNLVLELEFAEAADALRPGEGSTDYTIENVRVLASQVTLDSALYDSYSKILLSGRSLVFAYPTMHTQVSSIPAGSTSFNVTVARAFTKLLGAFVTFRDTDDLLGECSNFEHPGDGSQFSANSLESQMQLGALQYPRYPMLRAGGWAGAGGQELGAGAGGWGGAVARGSAGGKNFSAARHRRVYTTAASRSSWGLIGGGLGAGLGLRAGSWVALG